MNIVAGSVDEFKEFDWRNTPGFTIAEIKKHCGDYCMAVETGHIFNSEVIMEMTKILIQIGYSSILVIRRRLGQTESARIPSYKFLCEHANETILTIFIFNSLKTLEQFELDVIDEMKKKVKNPVSTTQDKLVVKELPSDS